MKSPLTISTLFLAVVSTSAFAPIAPTCTTSSSLSMAPRFDKSTGKWFTNDPEEMNGSSYGPIGSLYRAGPKPFLQRIFNAETYDQAVLKYMAQDGCDRKEAQGNMDAFLENPQDWAYQKVQEKNGAYKKDYANANMAPKQVALSTIWAAVVVYFFGNLAYNGVQGGMLSNSFHRTMELLGVNI
ncbi:hypothetical protein ACHAWU_004744 [Discostella pseudostelligera]|uniref:Uncharacterized protein n=1 Tax=Discostella pseudostelligera TaxID=259834 RepID=A0ABD3MHD1_9STRA